MWAPVCRCCFFCKQKTAYEMRISDWSSDVCASDLEGDERGAVRRERGRQEIGRRGFREVLPHSSTPSALATVKMSLSPRPQRLATMISSFEIGRASCRERVCQYV